MDRRYEYLNKNINTNTSKKIKKRKKNKRRKVGKFFLKLFLTVLFFGLLITFLIKSPFFNINSIEVYGNERLNADELKVTAGIMPGVNGFWELGSSMNGFSLKNLIFLRYGKQEKLLKDKYPYIKNVKVVYKLPQKVEIRIVERTPAVKVKSSNKYVLIDEDGYVLEVLPGDEQISLLELKGIDLSNCYPGQFIGEKYQDKLESFFTLLDKLKESDELEGQEPKIVPLLKSVDVADTLELKIVMKPALMVNLGRINDIDNRRLEVLRYLYKNNIKGGKGYLDFSSSSDPTYDPNGYNEQE